MAGLATGCYARMNGFRVRILEHNLDLGGVCAAWSREPYVIDGCVRWLMGAAPGGMFRGVYEEMGIVPEVPMRVLDTFATIEDPTEGWSFAFTHDLDRLERDMIALAPEDREEIGRLRASIEHTAELRMSIEAPELGHWRDRVAAIWDMRHLAGTMLHFRGDVGTWLTERVKSPRLRAVIGEITHPKMPALFVPMMLGSIVRGQMHVPEGGTLALRDAVVRRFRELGGEATMHATVEEILVAHDRAIGVRLGDGTIVHADVVVSTASLPETVMRLLGGRYVDGATRERIDHWPTFDAIAMVSLGIDRDYPEIVAPLVVREHEPFLAGDTPQHRLGIHVFRGSPHAPPEHAVVQAILPTRYDHWAGLGSHYGSAKAQLAARVLERLGRRLPGIEKAVRMTDVVTPLTFWRHARSWRGAFEGFLPTPETFMTHVPKQLPGLGGLWLAGQWVEPGGGIPPALLSGRQVVQLVCRDRGQAFVVDG